MARPSLRRFNLTVLRDKSPSDKAQIPFAYAQVDLFRQGATVSGAVTITNGTSTNVSVFDRGNLKAGDTVMVGVSDATLTVASIVSQTTVNLTNNTGVSVGLAIGDRLVPTNARPTAYADPKGLTALGSTLTADEAGQIGAYINVTPFDYVAGLRVESVTSPPATLTGNGPSLTWSHTVGGIKRLVVVAIAWQESSTSETLDSVTYGGSAMTSVGSAVVGGVSVNLFSLVNPATGAQNVVATWSGTGAKGAVAAAISFLNADLTTPLGTLQTNTSPTGVGTPTVSVTTTSVFALVLGVLGIDSVASTTTIAPGTGSGHTLRWSGTGGTSGAVTRTQGAGETAEGTGGTVVMNWALGTPKPWAVLGIQVNPLTSTQLVIDAEGSAFGHSPYGVVVTDFPTFQAAHDALPETGGTIFVPEGTYTSTTVPAFTGLVITKTIGLIGEENGLSTALSIIIHDMSGAKDIDAILITTLGQVVLKNLFIQGPGLVGTGRGVRWYKAGSAPLRGVTIDNVTVYRSANWAFEFLCDGRDDSFISKLDMYRCTAYEAMSGGSLFLGGAGSNNNSFEHCEFNCPGFGAFYNVLDCELSANTTVRAPNLSGVQAGDEVSGMGIAVGTTVVSVNTGVTPHAMVISANAINPTSPFTTTLSFYRSNIFALGGFDLVQGNDHVDATSVTGIDIGDVVSGPGIEHWTTVDNIITATSPDQIVLSAPATQNISPATLTFQKKEFYTLKSCTLTASPPSTTVTAPDLHNVKAGDQLTGPGIVPGTTVSSVNIGVTPNSMVLSAAPTVSYASVSLTAHTGRAGQLPRGSVHLLRTNITRFHLCTFQCPDYAPALTTDLVSSDLFLRDSYREVGTLGQSVHVFIFNSMVNVLIDGLYAQFHTNDSLLVRSGPAGIAMGKVANTHLLVAQNPLASTNSVELDNATDWLEVENCYESSSITGAVRDVSVVGAAAPIREVASVAAMTLPLGNDPIVKITGSTAITSIAAVRPGRQVALLFTGTATLTDGSNLKLDGNANFTGTANRMITLVCDGTNWWEVSRTGQL